VILLDYNFASASLIGATKRPIGLGYVYMISFKLENGNIMKGEVYLELFSLKAVAKMAVQEDFSTNLHEVDLQDAVVIKIIPAIERTV
jgi:hypothetical protein